jgi:hypothetical protein
MSVRSCQAVSASGARHYCMMELSHTSSPNEVANYVDRAAPEAFDHGIWPSKDPLLVASEFHFAPLHPTQAPYINRASDASPASSSKQPCATPARKSTSPPEQTKAKTACLRCRGKKSRCSGQRPCGGCSNDVLDCIWDDDEAKWKRDGRRSKSVEDKKKVAKGKNSTLQIRSACTRCQYRKAKCTGTKPACAYCVERRLECTYDVAEGETRTNDLERILKDFEIRAQAFGRILAVMREGNIYQATEVLARLRMGDSLRDVLQSLPTSIASPSPNGESVQSELHRRLST